MFGVKCTVAFHVNCLGVFYADQNKAYLPRDILETVAKKRNEKSREARRKLKPLCVLSLNDFCLSIHKT